VAVCAVAGIHLASRTVREVVASPEVVVANREATAFQVVPAATTPEEGAVSDCYSRIKPQPCSHRHDRRSGVPIRRGVRHCSPSLCRSPGPMLAAPRPLKHQSKVPIIDVSRRIREWLLTETTLSDVPNG
jgi:hypothetical protein